MATEQKIHQYLEDAGFAPIEHRAIIVKYAPGDALCDKLANFFSSEYYVLQLCQEELVLIPVEPITAALKKDITLQLSYASIQSIDITEKGMSYEVAITTDTDTIRLLAQKKEWSELRSSGTLATGQSFLNIGAMGMAAIKSLNWHKENMDGTLQMLQSL